MSNNPPPAIDALWGDYLCENLESLRSYSVSALEALGRGNVAGAKVYWDCAKLVGREIAVAFRHLEGAAHD